MELMAKKHHEKKYEKIKMSKNVANMWQICGKFEFLLILFKFMFFDE